MTILLDGEQQDGVGGGGVGGEQHGGGVHPHPIPARERAATGACRISVSNSPRLAINAIRLVFLAMDWLPLIHSAQTQQERLSLVPFWLQAVWRVVSLATLVRPLAGRLAVRALRKLGVVSFEHRTVDRLLA